ncbi:hypothetical protein [Aliikangiella coralliicola]|uniref:Uncharacterized protein n=1 Tax=Aliikangiella coralliicola TaxID=2592383 RepID=A0A545UDN5_9GAMM|nr:hypothetical protein [Aliikangiella coralliicola]TQV87575.1 hypothetical protein FLL46_11935 [Aliikangiella coralliicola]
MEKNVEVLFSEMTRLNMMLSSFDNLDANLNDREQQIFEELYGALLASAGVLLPPGKKCDKCDGSGVVKKGYGF